MKRTNAWGQHDNIPTLNPRVLLVDRTASALVYLHEGSNGEDYDACVQISWVGETAHLHSLTGSGFYLAYDKFAELLRNRGVKYIEGEVRTPHLRLLQQLAEKRGGTVEILGTTTLAGVLLTKMRIPI